MSSAAWDTSTSTNGGASATPIRVAHPPPVQKYRAEGACRKDLRRADNAAVSHETIPLSAHAIEAGALVRPARSRRSVGVSFTVARGASSS